jgi:DNA (cytosine-5)-methyltransferase 1
MKGSPPSPVIDLFAGPGGLGEGFSSFVRRGERAFRVALSIEMETFAHQTLELRSFFRLFNAGNLPSEYYAFLRGEISRDDLFACRPDEAVAAREEAWKAELGKVSPNEVDRRIRCVLDGRKDWVLCGGPPCQAYSIVGRSRTRGIRPRDHRLFLYREYLRILAIHSPPVFIMENVKGLLSSEVRGNGIFRQMIADLRNPAEACNLPASADGARYHILSLVTRPSAYDLHGFPVFEPRDFVIKCENYGIPQRRHRVILLGVREDVVSGPVPLLKPAKRPVTVIQALSGLPRLRSGLTGTQDGPAEWIEALKKIGSRGALYGLAPELKREMRAYLRSVLDSLSTPNADRGAEFIPCLPQTGFQSDWFLDRKINGVCNHSARAHMESDLQRYLYAACFAKLTERSPELGDFPETLLPAHRNIRIQGKEMYFSDRFRVQLAGQPATTITSHIAKDGHYYIHFDPTQCRSLTVREAARLQTFPDNYLFCGPRTDQYRQVGNAVPPLLARQVASIVLQILNGQRETSAPNATRLEVVSA